MFTGQALRGFINDIQVKALSLSAEASRELLIEVANREKARVLSQQSGRSGIAPLLRQVVDGKVDAPIGNVAPFGTVNFIWNYMPEIVRDTQEMQRNRSPRRSGEYIASQLLYVDGEPGAVEAITIRTREVKIVASAIYSRRLEVGKRADGSPFVVQVAPHIVEETMLTARRLFGRLANFSYGYVDLAGTPKLRTGRSLRRRRGKLEDTVRFPAITISPRTA
jgi:hypothetical protein